MKIITFLTVVLLITGCGKVSRIEAAYSGYSTLCVEGVSYLQFTSGATVQYTPDGKIKTCSK
jgi:hypothetical protein